MSLDTKTVDHTRQYAYEYLSALNCPRALTVWLLYSKFEHDQLTQLECDPNHYDILVNDRFGDSYAATKFLSKATFLKTSFKTEEVAIKKFLEAEAACRETNRRIVDHRNETLVTSTILSIAVRKIRQILGEFHFEEFIDSCDWGPGATTLIKRADASSPIKYHMECGITVQAHDFISPFFSVYSHRFSARPYCFESGNKIVTVPKNSKTDRVIAIEPGLNLWFQKGIGSMIRRRLLRWGVDLNHGQHHHDRLARLASKTNHLATVDFSAASDMISYNLVRELLPARWFCLLGAFRSASGRYDNTIVHYEKFSSMGNGYTFELESLIFFALALACAEYQRIEGEISVYGDDVVLPSSIYSLFSEISKYCGFIVNHQKSYYSGYFRESCGAYWYYGRNVKPIFQKEALYGTQTLLKSANNLRRLAHRRNTFGCDRSLRRCWQYLVARIPRHQSRFVLPEGYGDGGLVVNLEEAYNHIKPAPNQMEGWLCNVFQDQYREIEIDHEGLLSFKLRSIGMMESASNNMIQTRARARTLKHRILVPRWNDLGPWV